MITFELVQKASSDGEFCLDGSGELKIRSNKYGRVTLVPISYSSSCFLQKMVSDGELSLDDFRKLSLEVK